MNRKVWTQEEIDILTKMYPDNFAGEIAKVLGRGKSSIYCKARSLGLECTPEKIRRSGLMSSNHPNTIASRFPDGQRCIPRTTHGGDGNNLPGGKDSDRINKEPSKKNLIYKNSKLCTRKQRKQSLM